MQSGKRLSEQASKKRESALLVRRFPNVRQKSRTDPEQWQERTQPINILDAMHIGQPAQYRSANASHAESKPEKKA